MGNYYGGSGNDSINASSQSDTIQAGGGNDTVNAGDGGGLDNNPDDARSPAPGVNFHGSHVAGIIAAEAGNSIGGVGVRSLAMIAAKLPEETD